MPPQPLWVQCPPQYDIGPQPLPQEFIHALVHTSEQAEEPQPTTHVRKQPLVQSLKHQPEHEEHELVES